MDMRKWDLVKAKEVKALEWKQEVQLFWWSDTATADIPDELCAAIDEFFETLYEC